MDFLNYINGAFVPSQAPKTFSKISPFTGETLGQVTDSEALDLVMSLASSKKAFTTGEKSTAAERAQWLLNLADALEKNELDIAYQEALHQGLPQKFSLEQNVRASVHILRSVTKSLQTDGLGLHTPVGLIGVIAPWTLSLRAVIERLAPALAAGNAVIVKLSEHSPITGKILGDLFTQIQLPVGLVNLIQGKAAAAHALAGHPSIRGISAVGRTSTCESLVKATVSQLKKVQLSSGVKNATMVLGETDFKTLMPEILKPFLLGQGQLGSSVSRLFIMESVQAEFIQAMKDYLDTLSPLKDPNGDSVWTPMISAESKASILERIGFSRTEQGKIIWGGESLDTAGNYVQPAVTLDLSNCSVLQQDEVHGPLLILTAVKYQHEMAKWVNTSYLAQEATIWGPEEKALRLAEKLEVAQVNVNSWMAGKEVVPGRKQSFYGIPDFRWNGAFFSEAKTVTGVK